MSFNNSINGDAISGTSHTTNGHNYAETQGSTQSTSASNGSRSVLEVTGDHARILKVLDQLRELRLDQGQNAHSLPQIIVCGAQSSGKSSVLEAIAGIPFPRKSKLYTRYKTRVTLLRKAENKVVLRIIPEIGRSPHEAQQLRAFQKDLDRAGLQQSMPRAMEEAQALIFSGSKANKVFTYDILAITISGPEEQELELLDLPGLISFDDRSDGNIEMVKAMVLEEVLKPYSIVLAVVKATDDLQGHSILQMCKEHKVDRQRTLAVLTMPDQAPATRAAEYLSIMRGEDQQLKKTLPVDWHILLNRNDDDLKQNSSAVDRDKKENVFFEIQQPWNQVKPKDRGIANLRKRLSVLLFAVARRELPNLAKQLRERARELEGEMNRLGGDLDEKDLKKAFKHSTERLKKKVRDHARGIYGNDIYKHDGTHVVHLRSRVIDEGDVFRDRIQRFGHSWDLDGRVPPIDPDADLFLIFRPRSTAHEPKIPVKSKEEAIKDITDRINSMRKKGLPGFSNEDVINKEFWQLSENWASIAGEHVDSVFECCSRYFEVITPVAFSLAETRISLKAQEGFGNHEVVGGRYYQYYLIPALENLKFAAFDELKKLDKDRGDTCQNFEKSFLVKLRAQREQIGMRHTLNMLDKNYLLDDKSELDPKEIAKTLNTHTQERWTAETAEDCLGALWAHYETTCDRFISNVLTMIVERHLMDVIEDIIEDDLDVEDMRALAKADEDVEENKQAIREEVQMITKSLAALKPFSY